LEIRPAGANDLADMDYKESAISKRQPEMFPAGPLIAAQDRGEPGKLRGLVDGESGENTEGAHNDDERIRDALRRVIAALGRQRDLEPEIMLHDVEGFAKGFLFRQEFAPFA